MSSTTWSLHDSLQLEQRGIPPVPICTDSFLPLGRKHAELLGMNNLPIAVIQHPLRGIKPPDVHRRAEAAVDQLVAALSKSPAQAIPH